MRLVTAISADTPRSVSANLARNRLTTADGTCHRCGVNGHWMKDCPLKYNVRHLDTDELQEIIMEQLSTIDAAEAELTVLKRVEEAEEREGFQNSDG